VGVGDIGRWVLLVAGLVASGCAGEPSPADASRADGEWIYKGLKNDEIERTRRVHCSYRDPEVDNATLNAVLRDVLLSPEHDSQRAFYLGADSVPEPGEPVSFTGPELGAGDVSGRTVVLEAERFPLTFEPDVEGVDVVFDATPYSLEFSDELRRIERRDDALVLRVDEYSLYEECGVPEDVLRRFRGEPEEFVPFVRVTLFTTIPGPIGGCEFAYRVTGLDTGEPSAEFWWALDP